MRLDHRGSILNLQNATGRHLTFSARMILSFVEDQGDNPDAVDAYLMENPLEEIYKDFCAWRLVMNPKANKPSLEVFVKGIKEICGFNCYFRLPMERNKKHDYSN